MKEVAIKEICQKGSSNLKQKELLDKGTYPVYGASGISGYLETYHQEEQYIGIVKDGSGIGRVEFYPPKTSLIGTMQYILPKKGYDIRYIGYCLQSLDLSSYKQGAAIPHIYFRDYGERMVKVTEDLYLQQQIVSRLDASFAHIDALKANAKKQLDDAKALFQKALEKAMEPKEGWEEKKLKDLVDEDCPISYGIVQQGDHVENGIPVVRPVDLDKKIITREKLKCTTNDISNSYKRTILKGNEILLSVRGTTGVVALSAPELKGCNVNRGIVPLSFNCEVDKIFIYYEMLAPALQTNFAEKTTGSTLKQINIKDLRLIEFSFPPLSEQQAIVAQLDQLSEKVKRLQEIQEKTIKECDALKQAILRDVFE